MPKDTFFRLPEEKRRRILESAWQEFTRVPYTEVSINRIVLHARIPRGSFYQYFAGKEELFDYLIDYARGELIELFHAELERAHGDPFFMVSGAFDRLFTPDGAIVPEFSRVFDMFRLNANMDLPRVFLKPPKEEVRPYLRIMEYINVQLLKTGGAEYMECVISLLMSSFGAAVVGTLQDPSQYKEARERLHRHIEIVRNGSAAVLEACK